MSLKQKISRARKNAGLSQQALGEIIGVSDKAVSAYEVGRSSPPLKILKKISRATHQSLSYFIENQPQTNDQIITKLDAVERELKALRRQLQKTKV